MKKIGGVRLLTSKGSDTTPLVVAKQVGHQAIVALLEQ